MLLDLWLWDSMVLGCRWRSENNRVRGNVWGDEGRLSNPRVLGGRGRELVVRVTVILVVILVHDLELDVEVGGGSGFAGVRGGVGGVGDHGAFLGDGGCGGERRAAVHVQVRVDIDEGVGCDLDGGHGCGNGCGGGSCGGCGIGGLGEGRAGGDAVTELGQGDAARWVDLEDHVEDFVELVREREDGLEELAVCQVGAERGVLRGGRLPGVAAAGQVHQDDSEAPDIIWGAGIEGHPRRLILTFYKRGNRG